MSNHDVILRGIFVGPRREGTHRGYIRLDFYDLPSSHDKIFSLAVDFVGFRNCLDDDIRDWEMNGESRRPQPARMMVYQIRPIHRKSDCLETQDRGFHLTRIQQTNKQPTAAQALPQLKLSSAISNFHFLSFLLEVGVICYNNFSKRALSKKCLILIARALLISHQILCSESWFWAFDQA